MTADTDEPTLAVTQADRVMAAPYMGFAFRRVLDGECDDSGLVQQFARHRTNSEPRAAGDLRELLEDVRLSIECAAGCDEGINNDAASSEVMSFGGSALAVAYDKVTAALATHSPAPMADPMKVGLAIQSAWGEDDMGFDNTLPPIEFSDAELRHLGAAAIRAVAHPSTQEGGDRG